LAGEAASVLTKREARPTMDRTGRWDMGHSETHYKQIEKMT